MAQTSKQTKKTYKPQDKELLDPAVLERQLPYDRHAEVGMIGSMLLNYMVIDDVELIATPQMCFDEAHRALFETILELRDSGVQKLDTTLIVGKLRDTGRLETAGGVAYLGKIINAVPHAAHAVYYAETVKKKWMARRLIEVCTDGIKAGYDDAGDSIDAINEAESSLFDLIEKGTAIKQSEVSASELLQQSFALLEAKANGDVVSGLKSGFHPFDDKVGGFRPGELIILGGRPSQGKTALALKLVTDCATKEQGQVLIVSLEMGRVELAERMLSMCSRIDVYRIRNGFLSSHDRLQLQEKSAALAHSHLYVDDQPGVTVNKIAAIARRRKRQTGLDVVMIDYLQLITPDDERLPRQEQVARISRQLKLLARRLDVTVLCLAQLNRQSELGNRAPRMADLRESGALEQDADVVMFVHRPAKYDDKLKPQNPNDAEQALLIVDKQRNGAVGDVDVLFEDRCALYLPAAGEHLEQQGSEEFGGTGGPWVPPPHGGQQPLGNSF